jgi:predicted short-subunit dehydrogenase-like oxidoreductase (DUF2520 family)
LARIDPIQSISFVGSGNVAGHLARALQSSGQLIEEVFSLNAKHARSFAEQFDCTIAEDLQKLNPNIDLLIISVPDAKVEEVAKVLPPIKGIVAHTSGFTGMDVLKDANLYGVFYPLQTFRTTGKWISRTHPFVSRARTKAWKRSFSILLKR